MSGQYWLKAWVGLVALTLLSLASAAEARYTKHCTSHTEGQCTIKTCVTCAQGHKVMKCFATKTTSSGCGKAQ
jgi:hypothetical protein